MKKANFTKWLTAVFAMVLGCCLSLNVQAQCPVGQSEMTLNFGSGTFNGEISWDLVNTSLGTVEASQPPGGFIPNNTIVQCVPSGAYEFHAFDTFGDGWNGATVQIISSEDYSVNGCPPANQLQPPGAVLLPTTIPAGASQIFDLGAVGCEPCTITCPSDITVPNDPGECGADVTVGDPILDPSCQPVPTFTNLSATGSWTANPITVNVPATMTGAVMSNFGDVALDFTVEADMGFGFAESASLEGPDGINIFTCVNSNGDCTPTTFSTTVPQGTWNTWVANFGPDLTFEFDPCGSGINNFCNNSFTVDVSIATGALNFVNNQNANANASGFYPVGTTEVEYCALGLSGALVCCTFNVTVEDTEPPSLTCPSDITINLLPGACFGVVDFTPPFATDNCPFAGPLTSLTTNFQNSSGLISGSGGGNQFDITNNGALPILISSFDGHYAQAFNGGPGGNANFEVWYKAGTHENFENTPAAWTLLGSDMGVPMAGQGNPTPIAVGGLQVNPGETYGLYVTSVGLGTVHYDNPPAPPQVTDGTLLIDNSLGSGVAYPFFVNFEPRGWNGTIHYQIFTTDIPVTQCDATGLGPGDLFPIGVTTLCYEAVDAAGNPAQCTFDITVNEFPGAIDYVVCNDNVQVTLDEDCLAEVTADMILEGGPYGCYDEYVVTIKNAIGQVLATGGGAVGAPGALVDASFIGGTYTVEVMDPENGNIKCWGTLTVEDKLPPIMECRDLTISCTEDIPNEPAPEVSGPIYMQVEPNEPIGEPGAPNPDIHAYDFDYSIFPPGTPVEKFDVRITLIEHTWLPDLDIDVTPPDGMTTSVMTIGGCFGQEWPIDALFTDEQFGGQAITLCIDLDCGGCPLQVLQAGVSQATYMEDNFVGRDAGGTWNLSFQDDALGDDGVIVLAGMTVTATAPQIGVFDACDGTPPNIDLTFEESYDDGDCGEASRVYTRKWTAEDNSGNQTQCTQLITVARPGLGDVELPGDVMWTCNQYAIYPNIIDPTELHDYITDTDPATGIINVNLDPLCDDDDGTIIFCTVPNETKDREDINSTNVANGGLGCPGELCGENGLDDADVLELTGSGRPEITGRPIFNGDLCGLSIDHEDIWIDECEGTFKILRTWTLIDWCTDPVAVLEHNQVIKVVDVEGPELTTPNTPGQQMNINVYESSSPTQGPHQVCTGHVVIPPATSAGDVCSSVAGWYTELWTRAATSTPADPVGGMLVATIPSNGGIFWDIPLLENGQNARYVVRYVNKDECDNQTEGLMEITTVDRVPPVAVCDEITEISVTNNGGVGDGCSTLYAEDLDDGSYDNCKPVHYLMAKMDDSFSQDIFNRCYYPSRDFCCEEVGEDVQVILLVLDGDPSAFFTTFESATLGCDGTPGLFLTSGFSALNYNTCMVTVGVVDKLPPIVVQCPGPRDITCDQWWDEYEVPVSLCNGDAACIDGVLTPDFGAPEFYDNCAVNITPTVNINIDQCGNGTITRTWQAVDDAGNGPATCTQVIRVHHVSDWVVEFPADITVDCGTDAPDFGEPDIFFETCELLAVSYEDTYYDVVPDACYKIVRDWTVINWCVVGDDIDQEVVEVPEQAMPFQYRDLDGDGIPWEPRVFRDSWNGVNFPDAADALTGLNLPPDTDPDLDPWDGYIVYQQVIKVRDQVAPEFPNGCAIPDVCIEDNTCGATVTLPQQDIQDCSDDTTLSVDSDLGSGFGPFQNVAPGTYSVTYSVMDNCGNSNACASSVTVLDCKKPTPYCKNGIVVEVMQTGCIEIWANDLDDGSFDNCPGGVKLSFSADVNDTSVEFCCDQIGQQNVQLWVTDASNNQDFCNTFVIVEDNMDACGGGDDPLVAGTTATEAGNGVTDVDVTINEASGWSNNVMTDANGQFDLGAVPTGDDYTITPVKDVDPLNGVSTFDLVLISKHILGVQPLDSPYKLIAADANNTETVTTFDLVVIRKLILFIDDEFPNNTSWRFVRADHQFSDATNPWATDIPEVYNINNLTDDMLDADFVAIKVGDVNGNAAYNLTSTDDRNFTGALTFATDDVSLKAGETHTIEFTANDFNVSGYQFTLNFDRSAVEFVEVLPGLAQVENFGTSLISEGAITTSWNSNAAKQLSADEVVFSVVVTAKTDVQLSDVISINSRYTTAEAYNAAGELQDVALEFNGTVAAAQFELLQNTPNPFADATVIGFTLPEATSATLTISDVSGKVLSVIEGDFARGYNQVVVKRDQVAGNGVLYYQLDTPTHTATKKMILID